MVEGDLKAGEVSEVRLPHAGDEILLAAALGLGANHDRRAVGIVGAEIDRAVAAKFLEADKNIGLDVLDQMPEMDVAVGVGQGRGDENAASGHEADCRGRCGNQETMWKWGRRGKVSARCFP